MEQPLHCSTIRNPALNAPYKKKMEKKLNSSLNRNSKAPTNRKVEPSRPNKSRKNNAAPKAVAAAKEANYIVKSGSILEQPTGAGHYIVQQCCSACIKPTGLSESIAKKWGTDEFNKLNPKLNPYAGRKAYRDKTLGKMLATPETRDALASVRLLRDDVEKVNVICLFSQYGPGGPTAEYEDDHVEANDGPEARLTYFKKALAKIPKVAPAGSTLYIPYDASYDAVLRGFADTNKDYKVVAIKTPGK